MIETSLLEKLRDKLRQDAGLFRDAPALAFLAWVNEATFMLGRLAGVHNARAAIPSPTLSQDDVAMLSRAYACMPAGSDKKEFQALVERLTGAAL